MTSFVINQLNNNYFFKVPEIAQGQIIQKKIHNILLCDTSGSMNIYWKKVASGWNNLVEKLDGTVSIILFDDKSFKYDGKTLPLYKPRSGGTNIMAGIDELEKEIKSHKSDNLIRVFFVTDGETHFIVKFKKGFVIELKIIFNQ